MADTWQLTRSEFLLGSLLRFLTYERHKSSRQRQPENKIEKEVLGLVHASRDVFAKLWKLYRPRVMGGCLQGGGAYKLLREQENGE